MKREIPAPRPQPEELAKLHCIGALFGEPYFDPESDTARHLKAAIEFSITGSVDTPAPLNEFAKAALQLRSRQPNKIPPSYGLRHLDLRTRAFDPLWFREEAIAALKQLAGFDCALLLVSGLKDSINPNSENWTTSRQRDYTDAISYIEELAMHWSTPSSALTIIHN